MIEPRRWSEQQLSIDVSHAEQAFRQGRMREPVERYVEVFDQYRARFRSLLTQTGDLLDLASRAIIVLSDAELLETFRYLVGPPISQDDLETLADARSLAPKSLRDDPALVQRVLDVIKIGIDRRRFPWVLENRKPSSPERTAAVLATAALLATRRLETARRNEAKGVQERRVADQLRSLGFAEVPRRDVDTVAHAPARGEFCAESKLGSRKADFILRLHDDRLMPIECKVSNSSLNSVKRLNNDAAAKAEAWIADFGKRQIVPTAILSGVYKLENLVEAQERGLTLFWAHDLAAMAAWVETTRDARPRRTKR